MMVDSSSNNRFSRDNLASKCNKDNRDLSRVVSNNNKTQEAR